MLYWQYIGADKASMADAYFSATKKIEEGVYLENGQAVVSNI